MRRPLPLAALAALALLAAGCGTPAAGPSPATPASGSSSAA
ncbi:D-alanyl-D-alanine carboxypeptidase family protein, partial [Micrococcus sp. HSID17245]